MPCPRSLCALPAACSAFGDEGPVPSVFPVQSTVLRTVTIALDDKKIKFRVAWKPALHCDSGMHLFPPPSPQLANLPSTLMTKEREWVVFPGLIITSEMLSQSSKWLYFFHVRPLCFPCGPGWGFVRILVHRGPREFCFLLCFSLGMWVGGGCFASFCFVFGKDKAKTKEVTMITYDRKINLRIKW